VEEVVVAGAPRRPGLPMDLLGSIEENPPLRAVDILNLVVQLGDVEKQKFQVAFGVISQ